jgi:fermentation-respiration switch protein FrsA (DUF1100 family)
MNRENRSSVAYARTDVEFRALGNVTLRGWLYEPTRHDSALDSLPGIVMTHGFAGIKEAYLQPFVEVFAHAGFAVLLYDHRTWGASDGAPRHDLNPWLQIEDLRTGITFLQAQRLVDPARIGVWGTSFSGGHALVVAAVDHRVAAVVAQVPTISSYQGALRRSTPEQVAALLEAVAKDRLATLEGADPLVIQVVGEDPSRPAAFHSGDALSFYDSPAVKEVGWVNEITLRSLDWVRGYEPGYFVPRISPRPLLMIVAKHDEVTPTDLALSAYEQALEPKKLALIEGGHFSPYDREFNVASEAAVAWFTQHLAPVKP